MPYIFPDPRDATEDGLVAIGGDLKTSTLKSAYTKGIFPWPISSQDPLTWFSLNPRGILDLSEIHLSKSFKRFLNNHQYKVVFNQDFEEIINECAQIKRKNEAGTWIHQDIIEGYTSLFNEGHAYCVTVLRENRIVAGVYGVCFGQLITGESMFHKETDTSKLALYSLLIKLKEKNIPWIDTQMVTPVVESFGGKEISKNIFLQKLKKLSFESPSRDQLFS